MSEMQSLLAKAETPDLEFLVETLSSPWNLSSTGKMREALERTEQDPTGPRKEELRTLLESELRYAGSADLAFVTKKVLKAIGLRQKEPGVSGVRIPLRWSHVGVGSAPRWPRVAGGGGP